MNFKVFWISLLSALVLLAPISVSAFDPFKKACDGSTDANSASVCQDNITADPEPIYGPNGIIPKIANIVAAIGGIIAVVIIMMSGLKMIISSGDSKKLADARNAIIYAAVGIVVILMARVIISFILGFV